MRSPDETQGTLFHPVGIRRSAAAMDETFARQVVEVPTQEIRGMVRGDDPIESQHAAVQVRAHVSALQHAVLTILAVEGPHSAKQIEQRKEFRRFAPSTVRKRLSELANPHYFDPPKIVQAKDPSGAPLRVEGCAVYEIAGGQR